MDSRVAWSLALAALTGCATTAPTTPAPGPKAPPAELAAVVAPAPVRPEMAGPLTALLRGDRSDQLFTLGDETVRCAFAIERTRAVATCDGVVEEAPAVDSLALRLHTGDWQRRRLLAQLGNPARFAERTGLVPATPDTSRERNPFGPTELAYPLGELLDWTRFEVSERGETVRATFTSLDGPETIEASSLFVLGRRLRERQAELLAEQARRIVQQRDRTVLGFLLGHAYLSSRDRWQLDSVVVGQTRLGQLASAEVGLRLVAPDDPFWKVNSNVMALATERSPGASLTRRLPLGSVVVQAMIFGDREDPGDTYCAVHDEWLTRQRTPFTRSATSTPSECRWAWSDSDHRLDLVLTTTQRQLSVTWQPARFDRTEHTTIALEPRDLPPPRQQGPRLIDP